MHTDRAGDGDPDPQGRTGGMPDMVISYPPDFLLPGTFLSWNLGRNQEPTNLRLQPH